MPKQSQPAPLPNLASVLEQRNRIYQNAPIVVPPIAPPPRIGIQDAAPEAVAKEKAPSRQFDENLTLVTDTTTKLHRLAEFHDAREKDTFSIPVGILITILIPIIGVLLTLLGYWLFNVGMAIDLSGGE